MHNRTDLALECYKLTKDHDIPENIQKAIEGDYENNRHLYSKATIEFVLGLILLCPTIEPKEVLKYVRNFNDGSPLIP
jgi:hypothetical protein